jgi:hypothetical protein
MLVVCQPVAVEFTLTAKKKYHSGSVCSGASLNMLDSMTRTLTLSLVSHHTYRSSPPNYIGAACNCQRTSNHNLLHMLLLLIAFPSSSTTLCTACTSISVIICSTRTTISCLCRPSAAVLGAQGLHAVVPEVP